MKLSYNWLKWYIPEAPDAEKLVEIFDHHLCEVESMDKLPDGDTVLEIKILPNRAHDLLSHNGVARELASLLNIKYNDPTSLYKIPSSVPTNLQIKLESDKCRRYIGRIIRNVKVGPSPEWVVKHLESIGQRSINNMVDAANLVMYDCGQPTHVFDLDKVEGGLVARQAVDGEHLTTLDNKECVFKATDLIIADDKKPLAVAGVKGGKAAEVDSNTTNIILEVANFDPTSVRKTAQAFHIQTDAKKRFENDLSPELASFAMIELSALIFEMCPEATFEDITDIYPHKQEERKLTFSADKISSILGMSVTVQEIKNILERYNFQYVETGGVFDMIVPPMRLDLAIPEDMAEEIGRVMGYDKVEGKVPKINFQPKQNEIYSKIVSVRSALLNKGYSEVMNSTFRDKGEVSVLASAFDKNFLRTNLSDGLKESLKLNQTNAPLLGLDQIKIFEIGTVFKKSGPARNAFSIADAGGEEMHVAYGDKKEIKEMMLSEFTSPDAFTQVLGEGQPDHSQKHTGEAFKMWSLFPFIARDVAVWVPENVKSEDVMKVITDNMGDMVIRGPELFDEFKKPASPAGGDGKVSYAFRLVFQTYDRTLTDEEVNTIMKKIGDVLRSRSWEVR